VSSLTRIEKPASFSRAGTIDAKPERGQDAEEEASTVADVVSRVYGSSTPPFG
jgi:hypothetical protein